MIKIDFESIKTRDEAIKWAIDSGYAGNKTEAAWWLSKNIPKESYFQKKIMKYLEGLKSSGEDIFFWKEQAGPYQRKGIPDIIVCLKGNFIALEVKRPYIGRPSPLQNETIGKIKAAGGKAALVSTAGDVKKLFEELI